MLINSLGDGFLASERYQQMGFWRQIHGWKDIK